MSKRKKEKRIIPDVHFTSYAALGKAIGRPGGKVLFAEWAVPGDVADVMVFREKKKWSEGKIVSFKKLSDDRIQPVCKHFGVCGGCKWQMLPYTKQTEYKEEETKSVFRKEGINAPVLPIIGSDKIYQYRNKLEFTFSDREFLPEKEFREGKRADPALGYHIPGMFDKILNITECHLMDGVNDRIRNRLRQFSIENNLSFYNVHTHEGWLRNMIIRYATTGECLVNIVISEKNNELQDKIINYLSVDFPDITTLLFTVNSKLNDTILDLNPETAYGSGFIYENLGALRFKISPKSFFQTNTGQAIKLYEVVKEFADFTGKEIIYDLYCGTGSIGLYLHKGVSKVIGVEVVEEAVRDAKENAQINGVTNSEFFAGDVIRVCDKDFFEKHGKPDVVIVDPPRPGLHPELIEKLLKIEAPRVIYVSCNIATQARDLNLLKQKYEIRKLQPVDMFPQTYHIECVAGLKLK